MTQENTIYRTIVAHKTCLSDSIKLNLLEFIEKAYMYGNINEEHKNLFTNFSSTNTNSYTVRILLTVKNNLNIVKKRENIFANLFLLFNCLTPTTNQKKEDHFSREAISSPNKQVKLVGGRIVKNNVQNHHQNLVVKPITQTPSINLQNVIDDLLLDVWYINEYINTNENFVNFSSNIPTIK